MRNWVRTHMSAFGGKADIPFALHMSAFDPKRTSWPAQRPLPPLSNLLGFDPNWRRPRPFGVLRAPARFLKGYYWFGSRTAGLGARAAGRAHAAHWHNTPRNRG